MDGPLADLTSLLALCSCRSIWMALCWELDVSSKVNRNPRRRPHPPTRCSVVLTKEEQNGNTKQYTQTDRAVGHSRREMMKWKAKKRRARERKRAKSCYFLILFLPCCSVLIAGVLAFVVVPFQNSLFFHEQLWLLNLAVWCALWPPQIMLPVSLPGRSYFFIPLVFFQSSLFIFYFLLESKRASHSKLLLRRTITITQQAHTVYPKSNLPL